MPLLVALAMSISAPSACLPLAPQALISRCASQAPSAVKGFAALRAACPGLGRAIHTLGLEPLLPKQWRQALTPKALGGFDVLIRRYSGAPPSTPDAGALRVIARALKPPTPPPSLWDRVRAWIGRWTAPLLARLDRWLHSAGGQTGSGRLRAGFFVFAALLLLTLAIVVFLELRSAGLLRPRHQPALPRAPDHDPRGETVVAQAPDWSVFGGQPARVLGALIDALARSRRIARNRHLTCRELSSQARFDSESQRKTFTEIALLAERALYGPGEAPPVPQDTLRAAKALHVELQMPSAGHEAGAP